MCEFEDICRRHIALREIQSANGFTPQEYPLTELKADVCDPSDVQAQEQCPAYQDFLLNGRASQWAK